MKALMIYYSYTGNLRKIADLVKEMAVADEKEIRRWLEKIKV